MILIVTEKPKQAKLFAEILSAKSSGNYFTTTEYYIASLQGHILSIEELRHNSKLVKKYDPENSNIEDFKWFQFKDKIVNDKEFFPKIPEQDSFLERTLPIVGDKKLLKIYETKYNTLKELVAKSDKIILAVDPDEEGSALAYEPLIKLNATNKIMLQIDMQSMTKSAVEAEFKKAINTKKTSINHENMAISGLIRGDLDFSIGINGTTLLASKFNTLIKFGNQKARLCLTLYNRQKQIENFKDREYYKIIAEIDGKRFEYKFKDEDSKELDERRFDKEFMQKIYDDVKNVQKSIVTFIDKKNITSKSPKWFSGLDFAQLLAPKLNSSVKALTDRQNGLLQKMYQDGILTYIGTNGRIMTFAEFNDQQEIAKAIYDTNLIPTAKDLKFNFNLQKEHLWAEKPPKNQNHTPLTLDNFTFKFESLTADRKVVVKEAAKRILCAFAPDGKQTKENYKSVIRGHTFVYSETYDTFLGWKEIYSMKAVKKKNNFKDNEEYAVKFLFESAKTTPPKRFSRKTLLSYMEKNFIGTTNTSAKIIEDCINNNYFEIEKKSPQYINMTGFGLSVWKIFENTEIKKYLDEQHELLVDISKGLIEKKEALKKRDDIITNILDIINGLGTQDNIDSISKFSQQKSFGKEIINCPYCSDGKVIMKTSKEKKVYYQCNNKTCKFSLNKKNKWGSVEFELTEKNVKDLIVLIGEPVEVQAYSTKKDKNYKQKVVLEKEPKRNNSNYLEYLKFAPIEKKE